MTNGLIKGNIGDEILITVKRNGSAVNISTATVKKFKLRKPDGTVVERTAAFKTDGVDGKLTYTTIAGDIDQTGQWHVRVYLEMPTWSGHTLAPEFTVWSED